MRHAFRLEPWTRRFRREPVLATAIVLTIAFGVGVASTVFGYLGWFLFPKVDAPHAERVANVYLGTEEAPRDRSATFEFEAARSSGAFEAMAAHCPVGASVRTTAAPGAPGEGASRHAWGQLISGDYFAFFGARPAVGRLIAPHDERPGASPVVVLGHRLWRTQFGADPAVVGSTAWLNGQPHEIIGVAPQGFQGVGYSSEFFVPIGGADRVSGMPRQDLPDARWLVLWGRVAAVDGAWERAQAVLTGVAAGLDERHPMAESMRRRPLILPATRFDPEFRADPYFQSAQALAAAAALFLLLGAANVAGLLLARATARDREWALRKALGASPLRLARQVLADVLPLAALGLAGAFGVSRLLGAWFERTLMAPVAGLGPSWAPEGAHPMRLDGLSVLFALLATAVALAVALAGPLGRVLRRDPNAALRAESAGGGTGRHALLPRRLLVLVEVALAVVLLVGGGLLVRTLAAFASADPGFDDQGLTIATVHLPRSAGGAAADQAAYLRILDAARQVPGVRDASLAHIGPHAGTSRVAMVAANESPDARHEVQFNLVGPGYWRTLGVPLLNGRALDERDTPHAAGAVVVSRALAEKLWPGGAAVGRRLSVLGPSRPGESGPDFEVVGVSADAGFTSPHETARPVVFFAYGQRLHSRMALLLRTAPGQSPADLETAVRRVVAAPGSTAGATGAADADAALIELVPAGEQLRRTLHVQRLAAALAGGLALGALLTAVAGLAVLQAFQVDLRRRELAVRLSLGATPRGLERFVLADAARLALLGVAVGLAASLLLTRLLGGLVYGIGTLDLATFAGAPLLLLAAVLVSSWVPARRASRVDPIGSLRSTN